MADLNARALRLSYFTLGYNLLKGLVLVSVVAGGAAGAWRWWGSARQLRGVAFGDGDGGASAREGREALEKGTVCT